MVQFLLIAMSSFLIFSEEVVITIQPGTADQGLDWNDPENPARGRVGDTLVIINNDSELHRLHTSGRPCQHGEVIEPGEAWSCVLETEYNSFDEAEPIRDHMNYAARVWLIVEKQENDSADSEDKEPKESNE